MIAFLGALVLASATAAPAPGDLTARMRESAAAAQALQGPLDGGWVLTDHRGRILYVLQVTDPAGDDPRLAAAWRAAEVPSRAGPVDAIVRRGRRLTVGFEDPARGDAITVSLRRRDAGTWTGLITESGRAAAVKLRRPGGLGGRPPVPGYRPTLRARPPLTRRGDRP